MIARTRPRGLPRERGADGEDGRSLERLEHLFGLLRALHTVNSEADVPLSGISARVKSNV